MTYGTEAMRRILAFILRGSLQEFNRLFLANPLLEGPSLLGLLEGLPDLVERCSALGRILGNARVEILGLDGESLLLRHRLEEERPAYLRLRLRAHLLPERGEVEVEPGGVEPLASHHPQGAVEHRVQ